MIFIVTKIFTLRYLLFFHRNGTLLAQNVGKKFRPTAIKFIENETKFLFYLRYIERCNSYKNISHIILMITIINNHINDFSFGQNNKLSIIYFHT